MIIENLSEKRDLWVQSHGRSRLFAQTLNLISNQGVRRELHTISLWISLFSSANFVRIAGIALFECEGCFLNSKSTSRLPSGSKQPNVYDG